VGAIKRFAALDGTQDRPLQFIEGPINGAIEDRIGIFDDNSILSANTSFEATGFILSAAGPIQIRKVNGDALNVRRNPF
jgi:hypothetical protein